MFAVSEHDFYRAVGAAFWVFMAGVTVATAFWLVRRFTPPAVQWWLLMPLGAVIRRLGKSARQGFRASRQIDQAPPGR